MGKGPGVPGDDAGVRAAPTHGSGRAPRSDAVRNRARLVEAAAMAFAERGEATSLEEVAQRAGVGIGTLYRHFSTREALVEAIYRSAVESLCDAADELLATLPPDQALAEWMDRFVAYVATKRGMLTALRALLDVDATLFEVSRARLESAAARMLASAAASGSIRGDVDAGDLLRAMGGICMAADASHRTDQSRPLVGLLLDGLRFGAVEA